MTTFSKYFNLNQNIELDEKNEDFVNNMFNDVIYDKFNLNSMLML